MNKVAILFPSILIFSMFTLIAKYAMHDHILSVLFLGMLIGVANCIVILSLTGKETSK